MSSLPSAASVSSLDGDFDLQNRILPKTRVHTLGNRHANVFGAKVPSNGVFRDKTRTTQIYAFVFTDLAIFAVILPRKSKGGGVQNELELLEDIGICRVLSLVDHSGNLVKC